MTPAYASNVTELLPRCLALLFFQKSLAVLLEKRTVAGMKCGSNFLVARIGYAQCGKRNKADHVHSAS